MRTQYFNNRFFIKQILDFHSPFKNCMPPIKSIQFCQNHWSLLLIYCTWRDSIFDPRSLPDLLDWLWLGDAVDPKPTVVDRLGDHQVSVWQNLKVVKLANRLFRVLKRRHLKKFRCGNFANLFLNMKQYFTGRVYSFLGFSIWFTINSWGY